MVAEQFFTRVGFHVGEAGTGRRQRDCAVGDLGEAQQLQRFGDGEKIVDLHRQAVSQLRQRRLAVVGRGVDFFDHAGDGVGGEPRQRHAETEPGEGTVARRRFDGALGHQRIDLVDELAEFRIETIARMLQCDADLRCDAAGVRRQHDDAIAH